MAAALRLLPAIYVVLLASALHFILAKWFDRVPRHVVVIHALLIAIVLGPHLVLGRSLLPVSNLRGMTAFAGEKIDSGPENALHDDLLVQFLPTMTAVRDALSRGELPLRDDSVGGGLPLWADPQAQIFQPVSVLALPFGPDRAIVIQAALRLLLALTFGYLFFRGDTMSVNAGLVGSLVYGMGGFMQLWLGWPHSMTAAWLPVGLYATDRVLGSGRVRDSLLLAFATFGLLTAGHPETMAYAVVFGAVFTGWRLLHEPAKYRSWSLRQTLAPILLGASLTAPVNVPALLAIDQSSRSVIFEFDKATRERSAETPSSHGERLVSLLAPEAFGNDRYGYYRGKNNINEDGSGYPGVGSWALLLLLFLTRGCSGSVRFAGASLACCLLVIAAPPPVGWLIWKIPILASSASAGHRLLMIVALLFAWLSAECICRLELEPVKIARGVGMALALGAALALVYWWTRDPGATAIIASRRALVFGSQAACVAVVALAATMFNRKFAPLLVVVAIAAELLVAHAPANPPSKARLPQAPPVLKYLRSNASGWRVHASPRSLRPNVGSLYGVRTIGGSNPIQPYTWFALTAGLPDAADHDGREGSDGWLDVMSAKYVLEPNDGSPPTGEVVFADASNRVITRPTAFPAFRFASTAQEPEQSSLPALMMLPGSEAIRAIGARAAALGGETPDWLVASPPPRGGAWVRDKSFWDDRWRTEAADRVEIVEQSPTEVRLATGAPGPRLLLTTLVDDGGWSAVADEARMTITRVNGAFVGVAIPAGTRRVQLTYLPPGSVAGAAVGLVGLLLSAWLLARERTTATAA